MDYAAGVFQSGSVGGGLMFSIKKTKPLLYNLRKAWGWIFSSTTSITGISRTRFNRTKLVWSDFQPDITVKKLLCMLLSLRSLEIWGQSKEEISRGVGVLQFNWNTDYFEMSVLVFTNQQNMAWYDFRFCRMKDLVCGMRNARYIQVYDDVTLMMR